MTDCPCGSGLDYAVCCEPCITGAAPAATAAALMRSRYSAYVKNEISYLGETLHPRHRSDWDEEATRKWAGNAEWKALEILGTQAGEADDEEGVVEFAALYTEDNVDKRHHETSRFRKYNGRWYTWMVNCRNRPPIEMKPPRLAGMSPVLVAVARNTRNAAADNRDFL